MPLDHPFVLFPRFETWRGATESDEVCWGHALSVFLIVLDDEMIPLFTPLLGDSHGFNKDAR